MTIDCKEGLITAALAGLMSLGISGCGQEKDEHKANEGNSLNVVSRVEASNMTDQSFTEICKERSGTIEVHAHCGGVNSCKGLSWDKWANTLTEHTCKASNTCAGMSCVDPQKS